MLLLVGVRRVCLAGIAKIQAKEALRVVVEDVFLFWLYSTLKFLSLKNYGA